MKLTIAIILTSTILTTGCVTKEHLKPTPTELAYTTRAVTCKDVNERIRVQKERLHEAENTDFSWLGFFLDFNIGNAALAAHEREKAGNLVASLTQWKQDNCPAQTKYVVPNEPKDIKFGKWQHRAEIFARNTLSVPASEVFFKDVMNEQEVYSIRGTTVWCDREGCWKR